MLKDRFTMAHAFSYDIDGVTIETQDRLFDGRQLREGKQLVPPSDFVLVRTDEGIARAIALEDEVSLEPGVRAMFRSFQSDRTFTLTVEERGWEWGVGSIGEADIRAISGISNDRELFLDSDHDATIPRGSSIDLSGNGVERIRSRKVEPKVVHIVVNGRQREVSPGALSFEQLVTIAFPIPPSGQNVSLTASYRKGPSAHPEGSILAGQSVQVIEGMTFNVTATDKS